MRRLPVYLLLDTSGSMFGEPIESVKNGVSVLISALRGDPYALETAFLSIITFNSKAEQILPLTEIDSVTAPCIEANGMTVLGEALSLLADRISKEVVKGNRNQKGDWKPMVFIMTDGVPTDNYQKGIEDLKKVKTGIIVACAAGAAAEHSVPKEITENVVSLDSTDSESIKAFFKWVSASISAGSQSLEKTESEATTLDELPQPPDEVSIIV